MKPNSIVVLVLVAIVLVGGFALFARTASSPTLTPVATVSPAPVGTGDTGTPSTAEPMVVTLVTQNNLKQSGTATITENADGMAVVTLAMTGGSFPDPQPAHIHVGACPNPGAVKYPLTNVVNGASETTLDVGLSDLYKSAEPLALNIHKSSTESSVYTACGDLPVQTSASMSPSASANPSTMPSPVMNGY